MGISTAIIAGLIAMFCWGIADFLQAILVKKLGTPKTLFISHAISLAVTTIMVCVFFLLRQEIILSSFEIMIISASCLLQGIATYFFFKALEIGEVCIVAPISGTYSLVTVALAIIFLGEQMTIVKTISVVLIVFGIIFVSTDFSKLRHLHTVKGVKESLLAVLFWGIYFFLLSYAKGMFITRTGIEKSMGLAANMFLLSNLFNAIFVILIVYRLSPKIQRSDLDKKNVIFFLINVVLYTFAWIVINIGLVSDMVSLLVPVSSLYPAVTVILAAMILKEKLVKNQYIGLFVILAGIFMLGF
jgi:uncharacterized membrane protein